MSSLVANYSDSESEHSDAGEAGDADGDDDSTREGTKNSSDAGKDKKTVNFLTAEFSESEEEDEDEEEDESCRALNSSPSKSPKPEKMPLPSFQGSVMEGGEIPSVFQNPFQKAEEQRKAILEQHVKMTASLQEKEDEKKKKLPCYKFRKGQCHAGDKCRFFHDKQTVSRREKIDFSADGEQQQQQQQQQQPPQQQQVYAAAPKLLPPEPALFQQDFPPPMAAAGLDQSADHHHQSQQQQHQQQQQQRDPLDDDAEPRQKKKRVGLANNLVPPKRAMSNLSKQRAEERPWTVGT